MLKCILQAERIMVTMTLFESHFRNMLLSDTCLLSLACALVMQAKIEINKNFRRLTNKLVTKYLLNCHIYTLSLAKKSRMR